MRHDSSGVLVLPAPLEPSFADQIGAGEMVKIIELLRTFAGHIVIDTPAYFNEVVLALIEESDEVLLIAGMDIPNIKNVKIGLQTMRLLNVPMSKLHRSEEHTSELQSLMRISYAVFCLKKKNKK